MPIQLAEPPVIPPPPFPPRKRWTREEFTVLRPFRMLECERLELIDGELIQKMGKNWPHMFAVTALLIWLQQSFGARFVMQEPSIDVSPEDSPTSEPEPDLIVLRQTIDQYRSGNRQPPDIALLVEVSASSLAFDLTSKARLYARARIVEYWVLDVEGRKLYCHRDPSGDSYRSVTVYNENEPASPLEAPNAQFLPSQALIAS